MTLDEAAEKFASHMASWQEIAEIELSESDTRAKIIDQMLTQILGWDERDIKREPPTEAGYIDYLFRAQGRNLMVLEAKKTAIRLTATKKANRDAYKLHGPALLNAKDGIKQAQGYCYAESVGFTGLTTGCEWVAFLGARTDGLPASEHKAIVFPTIESIWNDFAVFYDLFSKEGVLGRLYLAHINEAEGISTQRRETLYPVIDASGRRLLKRSDISHDLERIFREFFGEMSGDKDSEMIAKCFVETPESRAADEGLEKIASHLTNKIQPISTTPDGALERSVREAVESQRGEFVLLVGNKGSGKSTYVDRFFSSVLPKELLQDCMVLRVDLRDSEGDLSRIQNWLTQELIRLAEAALFSGRMPTFEELQGIFYLDYDRRRQGEFKYLYENRGAFKINFGEYIDEFKRTQPFEYLIKLLHRAIKSSKWMPCVVLDNTDHYNPTFQEAVFQYAQAVFRKAFTFVIVPITDRTVWLLGKAGPLQSYPTNRFYLPVPSTKDILTKRISFVREKLSNSDKESGDYFFGKGIKLEIKNLRAFAAGLEEILVHKEYTARTISWLANYDVRRSLELTQGVFTSPWIQIEDLLKTYISGTRLAVENRILYKSIILGAYNHFYQDSNDFVSNVFSIHEDDISTPFMKISILCYLTSLESNAESVEEAYAAVSDIERYLEAMAYPIRSVRRDLKILLERRLVEPFDPSKGEVDEEQRLKISPSGKLHYEWTLSNETYLTEMAVVTGLRVGQPLDILKQYFNPRRKGNLQRADWEAIQRTFAGYCIEQDRLFTVLPQTATYEGERRFREEFTKKWLPN